MTDEPFGSADDYKRAFEALRREGLSPKDVALLKAHFDAPNHTATWAQLADRVGYASGRAINLHYGKLAGRVANELRITDPPNGFWLSVLAGWAEEADPDGHTAFVLRRPVIEALVSLGILRNSPKTFDRRSKAAMHRDEAERLRARWGVDARQVRYSDDGHWYARLSRFPAALFDAYGYLRFATEQEYLDAPIRVGKQISVRKPGISALPGYIRVEADSALTVDVDIHSAEASEGGRRLVQHLQYERSRKLVLKKRRLAASLACEICGFTFSKVYGEDVNYCEVHHLVPFSKVHSSRTRLQDLAIVCANCHRVIHLRNPPYDLSEVRKMLGIVL